MKKVMISFVGSLLIISLFGCGNRQEVTEYNLEEVREQTYEEYLSEQAKEGEGAEENKAFGKILWDAFYLAEIEGEQYGEPNADGHDEACFTIYDVDADGKNELIIEWPGDCMAAYVSYIIGYDDGDTHVEIVEFPLFTYYDNGIIEVGWSHNQGLAGDFWPYTVYKYNIETDTYDCIGGVDAWDGNYWETGVGGASFPVDIDKDGDKIVYYIFSADRVGYYDINPVDGTLYNNWRNEYLNGAKEIKLPFVQLNEENIEKLGTPKPDYQFDNAEELSGDELLNYLASLPDEPEELFNAGCFVITNKGSCYGQNYLETFLEDYRNDVSTAITIGQYTVEGDLILSYVEYDGQQITLTLDSRRDSFAENDNLIYTRNSKYFSVMELPGTGGSIMFLHDDPNMTPEKVEKILASSSMEGVESYGFYWIGSFTLE